MNLIHTISLCEEWKCSQKHNKKLFESHEGLDQIHMNEKVNKYVETLDYIKESNLSQILMPDLIVNYVNQI